MLTVQQFADVVDVLECTDPDSVLSLRELAEYASLSGKDAAEAMFMCVAFGWMVLDMRNMPAMVQPAFRRTERDVRDLETAYATWLAQRLLAEGVTLFTVTDAKELKKCEYASNFIRMLAGASTGEMPKEVKRAQLDMLLTVFFTEVSGNDERA